MALRSIPAILDYAARIERLAPDAWLLNFTNPAGLVVQALRDAGFARSIGICDSAENARKYAAAFYGKKRGDVNVAVYGLNHLSFTPYVGAGTQDVTARLIRSDAFLRRYYGLFDPVWIRAHRVLPNEYLYYYLHEAHALAEMRAARRTRGEQVAALGGRFFREWADLPRPVCREAAERLYRSVLDVRHETYMNHAWERTGAERPDLGHESEVEGYAGVALAIIEAITSKKTARIAVNVENRLPGGKPAIPGLAASDVVEVSCAIAGGKIVPDRFDRVAPGPLALIQAVKRYETLTCHALRSRKAMDAIDALAAHPLVPDRDTAEMIWNGYVRAHGASLGPWT
jgi:6-phospho-beta-glucosidase